ncbi:MAG: hypothetical protein ABI229_10110 [Gemmatimonadaceae bacterium]
MSLSDSSAALATARRLLSLESPEQGIPDTASTAVEHVFAQLFSSLSQWVGIVGCNALFARALALSAPHHPVLRGVCFQLHDGTPQLECLAENAREYGSQATTEAATTVLASVITMLSGLIGEDLAMSILEVVPPGTSKNPQAATAGTSPKSSTTAEGAIS